MTLADVRRAAAVAVLLAVAGIGLKSRGSFSRAANATATAISGSTLAITLAVTEGVALVAFIVVLVSARREHAEEEDDKEYETVFRPWLKYALFVLALAVLAVPPYLLYENRRTGGRPAPSAASRSGAQPSSAQHLTASSTDLVPVLAGVGLAVGTLVAIAIYARWRSRKTGDAGRRDGALAARLAAATDALHRAADPRQAIIACYAELERGFAAAGSAPRNADTPAEVLARAASAGLIHSRSAADLTGLFRRARYGTEPMTTADSAAAGHALDAMRTELAGQEGT